MNILKVGMWLSCLGVNLLGLVVVLRAGTTPAVIYAAFVSATLALNRPRISLTETREALETSRPALLFHWLWSRAHHKI